MTTLDTLRHMDEYQPLPPVYSPADMHPTVPVVIAPADPDAEMLSVFGVSPEQFDDMDDDTFQDRLRVLAGYQPADRTPEATPVEPSQPAEVPYGRHAAKPEAYIPGRHRAEGVGEKASLFRRAVTRVGAYATRLVADRPAHAERRKLTSYLPETAQAKVDGQVERGKALAKKAGEVTVQTFANTETYTAVGRRATKVARIGGMMARFTGFVAKETVRGAAKTVKTEAIIAKDMLAAVPADVRESVTVAKRYHIDTWAQRRADRKLTKRTAEMDRAAEALDLAEEHARAVKAKIASRG